MQVKEGTTEQGKGECTEREREILDKKKIRRISQTLRCVFSMLIEQTTYGFSESGSVREKRGKMTRQRGTDTLIGRLTGRTRGALNCRDRSWVLDASTDEVE
eukprot:237058-Amorphochlora_amoeboformis.AAC.1